MSVIQLEEVLEIIKRFEDYYSGQLETADPDKYEKLLGQAYACRQLYNEFQKMRTE